jgi:hypothetical protein
MKRQGVNSEAMAQRNLIQIIAHALHVCQAAAKHHD